MSKKAHALAADLAADLTVRLASLSLTVTLSADTDLLPLVKVGTQVAGSQSALIKITTDSSALAKDVLGLTQQAFSPHKIQLVLEGNPIAGAGADVMAWPAKLSIIASVVRRGCKVELYETANTNAVDVSDIASANLKTTFQPDLAYGVLANQ